MLNRQGRPTSPQAHGAADPAAGMGDEAARAQGDHAKVTGAPPQAHPTFTGNRALAQVEPLLFEIGRLETTGVDIDEPEEFAPRLGGLARKDPIGLPGLSEPEAMRHYVRLSQKNYGIDTGLFPLGSCTMKHNPRLNERMARLPGIGDLHPLQPVSTAQGALELMLELARYLTTLTGMSAVALSPKAGAHGELCGMMAIKAAIDAKGEGATRRTVLVPDSAHGTNPATAALIGFEVKAVPAGDDGWVHLKDVKPLLGPDVAAIMLTNPNTCGLFEPRAAEIAAALHEVGAYFYCDGANFNAIVGKVRPGDLGVDAMHINLHKTFSTPHGGGGPGAGPVVLSERLAPYAPVPFVHADSDSLELVEHQNDAAEAAQRQLRPRRAVRADVAAVRRQAVHARGAVRRRLAEGHRHHDPRRCQGIDRRGLSSDDHVFPARGARRHADRADRIGVEGLARRIHRRAARSSDGRKARRHGTLYQRALPCPAPPPGRDARRARARAQMEPACPGARGGGVGLTPLWHRRIRRPCATSRSRRR
jgi:hypothetical protein